MFQEFTLRPFQRQALEVLENPSHVICVAPTGAGKSLIFETAARKPSTRMVLVSPLMALARQQDRKLRALGAVTWLDVDGNRQVPSPGRSGVWITSPESLSLDFRQRLWRRWKPNFLVVDECHCFWDWGERFRPAFSELPKMSTYPTIERSLWLTATLPREARQALLQLLPQPIYEIGSFDLPSQLRILTLRVPWVDRLDILVQWLERRADAGIIFVFTRSMSQRVARALSLLGRPVHFYHGGMSTEERKLIEGSIQKTPAQIVVATSAFGMGMDYPQFKWVVLFQAPLSLLSLTQAIGRVSREDTAEGTALVLWDSDDARILEWSLVHSARRKRDLLDVFEFLSRFQCRKALLRNYFETPRNPEKQTIEKKCGNCDYCLTMNGNNENFT